MTATTTTSNGFPAEARTAAELYVVNFGAVPIPLPFRTKKPTLKGWEALRPDVEDLDGLFPQGRRVNVGLLLGAPSGGLLDIDLDSREAIAAAPLLLPRTGWVSGRKSNPKSHYWYQVNNPPATASAKFKDLRRKVQPGQQDDAEDDDKRSVLVEVRSTGGQTVVPPSVHDSGEAIIWYTFTEPAVVELDDLRAAVRALAAAALIARWWPPEGERHDISLAIAGGLLHAGWSNDRAETFLHAVCVAAKTGKVGTKLKTVVDTRKNMEAGKDTTGWPRVAELFGPRGDEIVSKVRDWLGIADKARVDIPLPVESPWPAPLAEEAFHGLAGDVVRALEPQTEAHPAALLIQFLVAYGNVIGRSVCFEVESDRHYLNLFAVLVGQTSKSRKGTSWGRIRALFEAADPGWADRRIVSGLSSGEGLIWHVRDPIMGREKVTQKGQASTTREYEADPGEPDKRLLVVEPEFAGVLKRIEREGNSLSAVLRQAWETGSLRTLVKNLPTKATAAHVSLAGHITAEELRRYLSTTEMANGFANRIVWLCVKRSKCLPSGGQPVDLEPFAQRLKQAIDHARQAYTTFGLMGAMAPNQAQPAPDNDVLPGLGHPAPRPNPEPPAWPLRRNEDAEQLWVEVYPELSEGKPGLSGALTGRAEAQTMRLACLFALLDLTTEIRPEHLMAGLAVAAYVAESVRHVFGDSLGDPVADELLRLLHASPNGLTRTEIRDYFQRNASADRIGRALGLLLQHKLAHKEQQETGGRPSERWFAAAQGRRDPA
jgi:hypothetical protein